MKDPRESLRATYRRDNPPALEEIWQDLGTMPAPEKAATMRQDCADAAERWRTRAPAGFFIIAWPIIMEVFEEWLSKKLEEEK